MGSYSIKTWLTQGTYPRLFLPILGIIVVVTLVRYQLMFSAEVQEAVEHQQAQVQVTGHYLLPLLVQASLAIAEAIIAEASLSFLGLGQQPPAPSWGSMLNSAQRFLTQAPWLSIMPGLAIFVVVLAFNLVGDGLRDALDPRADRK